MNAIDEGNCRTASFGVTMDTDALEADEMARGQKTEALAPFGVRLRAAIDASKKYETRADFLRRLGLDPAQIYRYETGERTPRFGLVQRMAAALGVSVADLAGEDRLLEEEWEDWPAWIALEKRGRVDELRQLGVPESNIQAARRWDFRGEPEERDYERLFEADLLGAKPRQLIEARKRRDAVGKPALPLNPKKNSKKRQS